MLGKALGPFVRLATTVRPLRRVVKDAWRDLFDYINRNHVLCAVWCFAIYAKIWVIDWARDRVTGRLVLPDAFESIFTWAAVVNVALFVGLIFPFWIRDRSRREALEEESLNNAATTSSASPGTSPAPSE